MLVRDRQTAPGGPLPAWAGSPDPGGPTRSRGPSFALRSSLRLLNVFTCPSRPCLRLGGATRLASWGFHLMRIPDIEATANAYKGAASLNYLHNNVSK